MKELLPDIERWRDAGKKVAIATVVQAYGSAPRRPGAKMAIAEDGEFVGSVSGGCVENDVVEHAKQVLEEDHPRLVPYGISDEMAFNVGLACGGQIEVFIQPFGRAFPTEKPVAFAYVVDGDGQGNGLLAWEFGKHRGSLGQGDAFDERVAQDAIAQLRDGRAGPAALRRCARRPARACSSIRTRPSRRSSSSAGCTSAWRWRIWPRPSAGSAWSSSMRAARGRHRSASPTADEIHVMHADDYLQEHPLGSNAYVAVLSHDPEAGRSGAVRRAAERRALRRRDRQPEDAARAPRAAEGGRADRGADRPPARPDRAGHRRPVARRDRRGDPGRR